MKSRLSAVGLVITLCAGACAIIGFTGAPARAEGADTTPPDTYYTARPLGQISDTHVGVGFSGTDETTSVANLVFECTLDALAPVIPCTSPYNFDAGPGSHTVSVRARDEAGNFDPTPATTSWFTDSPPETTIDSGPDPLATTTTPGFTFSGTDNVTASDDLTFNCAVDGGATFSCTSPLNLASDTSTHTLSVAAVNQFNIPDPTPATYTWNTVVIPPPPVFLPTTLVAHAAVLSIPSRRSPLPLTVSATLTSGGHGVYGRTIHFTLRGNPLCNGVTDHSGYASCQAVISAVLATLNLDYNAHFFGDAQYLHSDADGDIIHLLGLPLP